MSAIGDYIHFTRQGYQEFGIGRTEKNNIAINFAEIRRDAAQEVIAKIKMNNEDGIRQILTELENIAAGIMDTKNLKYKDQRAAIESYLQAKYVDKIKAINWDSGTVTPMNERDVESSVGQVHWEYDKDNADLISLVGSVETLAKKVEKINQIVARQIKDISKESDKNLNDTLIKMNALYQEAFDIQQKGNKLGIPSSAKIPAGKQQSFKQFQRLINQLIHDYAPIPPVALYEGTLWEAIIGAIGTTSYDIGMSAILQAVKEAVVGDESIKVEFNHKTFMASNTIKKAVDNASVTATADAKRRKVDVFVQYKSQDLRISAKNIRISNDLYKWVSAVSQTNFSALVESVSNQHLIDFINHYLNLYTLHADNIGKDAVVKHKLNENKEVNDTMKAYLFFAGLAGAEKQDFPNIFAIHDKASGKIKFLLMSDVISSFIDRTSKLSVKLNGTPISKFYFKQQWVDGSDSAKPEYSRIAALTAGLHKVKITASFNIIDTVIKNED